MTANNITYAVFGKPSGLFGNDQGYWDFFAPRGAPGRLPVWGFATVTESAADGVAVGENFYGYYPMASHAVLPPGAGGPGGSTGITPARTALDRQSDGSGKRVSVRVDLGVRRLYKTTTR